MSGVGENGEVSRFVSVEELFAGRHFDAEIVMLCVRWYLSFKLSYRDLVSMMNERGIRLAHTTILRWVQHYTPDFEKRWKRYARPVGGSWRMDETYVKVRGEWVYLCRAVDKAGKTVDFLLSQQRDVNAAKAQGKGNLLLFPSPDVPLSPKSTTVRCRDRLGGLLKFYSRVA